MALISSMYDPMDSSHQQAMDENQEHLANMLDFAIKQLVEMAEDNEIMLVDEGCICKSYEQIFDCLKHWSSKRIEGSK